MAYDPQEDRFTVLVDPQQATTEDIFGAVYVGGKQAGQNYLSQLIS